MKPYGREKHITGGNKWKTDGHFHPKHLVENWWESICDVISRRTMKQNLRREIEQEYE